MGLSSWKRSSPVRVLYASARGPEGAQSPSTRTVWPTNGPALSFGTSHLEPPIWSLPFGASHLEPLTDFGKMGSFSWKIPLSLNKSASYIFLGFNTGTLPCGTQKTEALSTNSTSFHLCRPATQHNRAVPPSPGLAPVSSGLSSIPAHGREPPTGESTRESVGARPGGSPRGILLESLRRALATLNPLPPERPCISPHASSGKMRP